MSVYVRRRIHFQRHNRRAYIRRSRKDNFGHQIVVLSKFSSLTKDLLGSESTVLLAKVHHLAFQFQQHMSDLGIFLSLHRIYGTGHWRQCETWTHTVITISKTLPCFRTNDNFWQAIGVFMFQGECTVNLNNLFSKPSTPILTWTNPRQSFLGNYDYASHFTYDNSSVSVRFHFLDLHLPSSASVWSVLFGFSTM